MWYLQYVNPKLLDLSQVTWSLESRYIYVKSNRPRLVAWNLKCVYVCYRAVFSSQFLCFCINYHDNSKLFRARNFTLLQYLSHSFYLVKSSSSRGEALLHLNWLYRSQKAIALYDLQRGFSHSHVKLCLNRITEATRRPHHRSPTVLAAMMNLSKISTESCASQIGSCDGIYRDRRIRPFLLQYHSDSMTRGESHLVWYFKGHFSP